MKFFHAAQNLGSLAAPAISLGAIPFELLFITAGEQTTELGFPRKKNVKVTGVGG